MQFDRDRVLTNVRQAETDDLLDRATVYRAGMEPEALDLIEAELRSRGVTEAQLQEHAQRQESRSLRLPDGTAARCSFCERPATAEGWDWHRLWGLVPLFPRLYHYCDRHQPAASS